MKKLEELEKEYEGFIPVSTYVTSLEELHSFLEVGIGDTYDIEKDYDKELRENWKWRLEAEIRNFFFFIFEQEEVELYDDDNNLLKELKKLVITYRGFYTRMHEEATEDNFQEYIKLVDFLTKYYNEHIDYFEAQREKLELIYKGINVYDPRFQDNREVVEEFANKKLDELKKKNKVFVKKAGYNENNRGTI